MQGAGVEDVGESSTPHQLYAHFARLPPRYQLFANMDGLEVVLMHQKLLDEAMSPESTCPVFQIRLLENFTAKTDENGVAAPIHEVTFAAPDNPKLLSQLSGLLYDTGLHIREAHVFSTSDGYSINVFAVDGWVSEDTDGLYKALKEAVDRSVGKTPTIEPECFDWEIDWGLLTIGEKIGGGSSGDLCRGVFLGQNVAIKVLKPEQLDKASEKEFAQEITILREVQHENVVRFIGACTRSPNLCIVTEHMPGGSLSDFLRTHNVLELSLLLKFAIDICKGMEYLHQKNIIHRDLKSANLLMDIDQVVKVSDFGVARFLSRGGEMTAETGTYKWMAPEVILHQPYNEKADVFSFAIVLWELTTAKMPYDTMTPVQAVVGVVRGLRPTVPENANPRLQDLMQRCWESVPSSRPSFSEIIIELEGILQEVMAASET